MKPHLKLGKHCAVVLPLEIHFQVASLSIDRQQLPRCKLNLSCKEAKSRKNNIQHHLFPKTMRAICSVTLVHNQFADHGLILESCAQSSSRNWNRLGASGEWRTNGCVRDGVVRTQLTRRRAPQQARKNASFHCG